MVQSHSRSLFLQKLLISAPGSLSFLGPYVTVPGGSAAGCRGPGTSGQRPRDQSRERGPPAAAGGAPVGRSHSPPRPPAGPERGLRASSPVGRAPHLSSISPGRALHYTPAAGQVAPGEISVSVWSGEDESRHRQPRTRRMWLPPQWSGRFILIFFFPRRSWPWPAGQGSVCAGQGDPGDRLTRGLLAAGAGGPGS